MEEGARDYCVDEEEEEGVEEGEVEEGGGEAERRSRIGAYASGMRPVRFTVVASTDSSTHDKASRERRSDVYFS